MERAEAQTQRLMSIDTPINRLAARSYKFKRKSVVVITLSFIHDTSWHHSVNSVEIKRSLNEGTSWRAQTILIFHKLNVAQCTRKKLKVAQTT